MALFKCRNTIKKNILQNLALTHLITQMIQMNQVSSWPHNDKLITYDNINDIHLSHLTLGSQDCVGAFKFHLSKLLE